MQFCLAITDKKAKYMQKTVNSLYIHLYVVRYAVKMDNNSQEKYF